MPRLAGSLAALTLIAMLVILALGGQRSSSPDEQTRELEGWWDRVDGAVEVVPSSLTSGGYAVKFTVGPHDCPLSTDKNPDGSCKRNRTEVQATLGETYGDESWWGFSLLFPEGFSADTNTFNIVTQWKSRAGPNECQPVLVFTVKRGSSGPNYPLWLEVRGGASCADHVATGFPLGTVTPDQWTRFVVRVRWDWDRDGFVEVWRDGTPVVPKTHHPNHYRTNHEGRDDVYLRQGVYRGLQSGTYTVYLAGTVRGTSYDDVVDP